MPVIMDGFGGMSHAVFNFLNQHLRPFCRLKHRTLAAVDGVLFGNQCADGMFQIVGLFFV